MHDIPASPQALKTKAEALVGVVKELLTKYASVYEDVYWQDKPDRTNPDLRALRATLLEGEEALAACHQLVRRAINRLIIPVTLCSHCDEGEVTKYITECLCDLCHQYRTKHGKLPSDQTLAKRYGWGPE